MEWSLNPLVAIGIGIAVMFFGYFFGLFEGRGQGYKNRKKEEADEKKNQPVPLPPANPPAPSDETSILNVSMDDAGMLRLKLDGQQTDTTALDPEKRKRLIAILTQIRPWLEAPRAAASPARPQPASVSGTPPVSTPKPAPAQTPSLAPRTAAPPPVENDEDEPVGPQSIVMQINSVLQMRLVGTPLASKGIRLQESLDGGVLVWVGMQKFEGVEDVPDETIKAALKSAISEWENKYTPGL